MSINGNFLCPEIKCFRAHEAKKMKKYVQSVLLADTAELSLINLSVRQKLPAGSEVLLGGKLELMKCGCRQNIKFHQAASQCAQVKFRQAWLRSVDQQIQPID